MWAFSWWRNSSVRGAVVGLVCALVCCSMNQSLPLRGAENWALDNCFLYRGPRPTNANVVVIGIDEESLQRLDRPQAYLSPKLAEVVQFLHRQGAKAVALDFLIPDDAAGRDYLMPGAEGDATTLGKAINQTRQVVLPEWLIVSSNGGSELRTPLDDWKTKHFQAPAWTDFGFANLTTDPNTFLRRQQLRA